MRNINENCDALDECLVLKELCSQLQIEGNILITAQNIRSRVGRRLISADDNQIAERSLAALCVFISVNSTESSISASQILQAARVTVPQLFDQLASVRDIVGSINESVLDRLCNLRLKYLVSCPLYAKLNKLLVSIFRDATSKRELCWLLFITVKGHLRLNELVACLHLLLCCLHHVIATSPAFLLKAPFDALLLSSPCQDKEFEEILLRELCSLCHASFNEVANVRDEMFAPYVNNLPSVDVTLLRSEYESMHEGQKDIDETLFLLNDPHLQPPLSHRETNNNVTEEETNTADLQTPIRSALGSVQSLHNLLQSSPDGPPHALVSIAQTCAGDPLPFILNQMTACQTLFLEASKRSDFDHVAELRFQMASKLFYKTLISLLQLEQNEDSSSELSALLQMAKFLKSLLACCIEVVMATYNNSWSFEWILRVFNLHGFDLFRVLGSFLKAETQLPSSVAKHLQNVEDEIILHVVWKAQESPLFDTLLSNRDDEELQNHQLPWLQSNSLSLFFVKACRLAHHRMSILCGHLDLNSDLQKQIWSCIETCICHRTKILQDRHLDQVIMCALYGVCKIREKDITFRSIVKKYLLLPHSSSQVYRHVAMPDEAASSIISFYNQIFMQQLKDHLVAISTPSPQRSASVKSPVVNTTSASPVYTLPGRKNFYISPMKEGDTMTFKPPPSPSSMTPRTRRLYSFGESSGSGTASERLRQFNAQMRASSPTLSPAAKRAKVHDSQRLTPSSTTRKSLNFSHPQ